MTTDNPEPAAPIEPGPEGTNPPEPPATELYPPEPPQPEAVPTQVEPVPPEAAQPAIPPAAQVAPPPPAAGIPTHLSAADERTWAMLAHLSVLLNLVTGFLGPVGALAIYFAYKDRSRYVAYQALQAAIFQLIGWVGGGAIIGLMWTLTGLLSAVLIGLLCIPFAIVATIFLALLPLATVVYGVIGAIETSQGRDFRYWLVGDWVRGTLLGS